MCRRRVSLFAYCIDRLFDFRIASLQRSNPCISFLSATSSFMGSEMAAVYQDKFFFFFPTIRKTAISFYSLLISFSCCQVFVPYSPTNTHFHSVSLREVFYSDASPSESPDIFVIRVLSTIYLGTF